MVIRSTRSALLTVPVVRVCRPLLTPIPMSISVCMSVPPATIRRLLQAEHVCKPVHRATSASPPNPVRRYVRLVRTLKPLRWLCVLLPVVVGCLLRIRQQEYAQPVPIHINADCPITTWADSTTYKCVTSCPPGYFADSTSTTYVCRTVCSNASEFGHPLTRTCVPVSGCTAPYVYADSTSRQCVTKCPVTASTYGHNTSWTCSGTCTGAFPLKDPSTQTCVANCPSNPSLYADSLVSGSCVEVCPTIYYAVEASRTCETACTAGFYAEPVSKKCVSNCPTEPVLKYFYSGTCVITCPPTTLADPTTLTCITTTCPSNPAYFA